MLQCARTTARKCSGVRAWLIRKYRVSGDRRDLVRLVLDRHLGEHETLLHSPS